MSNLFNVNLILTHFTSDKYLQITFAASYINNFAFPLPYSHLFKIHTIALKAETNVLLPHHVNPQGKAYIANTKYALKESDGLESTNIKYTAKTHTN